jgi:hypothetical protein
MRHAWAGALLAFVLPAACSSSPEPRFYRHPMEGSDPPTLIRYSPTPAGYASSIVGLGSAMAAGQLTSFSPDKPAYKNAGRALGALGSASLGVAAWEYADQRREDALTPVVDDYFNRKLIKGWSSPPR